MDNHFEQSSENETGNRNTSANVLNLLGAAIIVAVIAAVFLLMPWSNIFKVKEDTAYMDGTAAMARKEWSKAVPLFEKSLKANPDNADAFIGLSRAYTQLGKTEKALQAANSALQLDPINALSHSQRGIVRKMQGKFDEALVDFSNSVKLDPKSAWSYAQIADLYLRKQNLEMAITNSNKARKLKPDFVEALRLNAMILTRMGKYNEAMELFNRLDKLSPGDPMALQDKAWFLLTCPDDRIRNVGKGMELAKKAFDLSKGKEAIVNETLAEAYFKHGDPLNALELQMKAIALRIKSCPDGSCVREMQDRLKKYQMAARHEERNLYDVLPSIPPEPK